MSKAQLVIAAVALSQPAHADDASYSDALHRASINWLPWMQNSARSPPSCATSLGG